MDRTQRRVLVGMAALAMVCALAQAFTGAPTLVLYLTPLFLLVTLLLCGRYIGEERIVAHWAGPARPRARRARPRWARVAELSLASLLSRSPVRRRGPPAPLPLAA
jgi:hypothetical protein